jgi:hypothetical protein
MRKGTTIITTNINDENREKKTLLTKRKSKRRMLKVANDV